MMLDSFQVMMTVASPQVNNRNFELSLHMKVEQPFLILMTEYTQLF